MKEKRKYACVFDRVISDIDYCIVAVTVQNVHIPQSLDSTFLSSTYSKKK